MFILLFNHFKKSVGVAGYETSIYKASHDSQRFVVFF